MFISCIVHKSLTLPDTFKNIKKALVKKASESCFGGRSY